MLLIEVSLKKSVSAAKQVFLACSGGLDSQVMLHAFLSLKTRPKATVCFVDYQSAHAREACEAVAVLCRSHDVTFLKHEVIRDAPSGESPEAYWRKARYEWFKSLMKESSDVLLTAHHQDDQAETVLLQLCRGAGLLGLGAMPAVSSFGVGKHVRPFLSVSRASLKAYADEHSIVYVDDPSNNDTVYARNFIRHAIMPRLESMRVGCVSAIARSAEHCQEAHELLAELARLDTGIDADIPFGSPLGSETLSVLSPARQKLAIRHWMRAQNVRMPSAIQLETVLLQLSAGPDKHPCVLMGECEMFRVKKSWYLRRKT